MLTGYRQSLTFLQQGAGLTGLCMLAALIAASAWVCLRPGRAGHGPRAWLLPSALVAPLLMFASLAYGLGIAQGGLSQDAPGRLGSYYTLVWLLYGLVGLQQLYALHRLASWPEAQPGRVAHLAAATVLLPLAMALALLALGQIYIGPAGMPPLPVAAASLSAISGILASLPMRQRPYRAVQQTAVAPKIVQQEARPAAPPVPESAPPATLSAAQEMELRLAEIAQLMEHGMRQAEHAEKAIEQALLEKHEKQQSSTILQQVTEQQFLFESGLPCKLGTLVNGLIILDLPLDLRDHVRGDSLLHAAAREGNAALAQQLIENDADIAAINWAGVSAHACTRDPAMRELLEEAARVAK